MEPSLEGLAAEVGVAHQWLDAWGQSHEVTETDLRRVVEAVTGRVLGSEAAVSDAMRGAVADRPSVTPVIVAWDGDVPEITVKLDVVDAAIVTEDGREIAVRVEDDCLLVSERLPIGYHELIINGGSVRSHVFSAPRSVHPAPSGTLGVIAPLYSLWSTDTDRGIGSLGELSKLSDFADAAGVEIVGTLPLLACFPDQPSPYAPATRRAWNEVFVDFSVVPDWQVSAQTPRAMSMWVDYETTGDEIRAELALYSSHVSQTPRLRAQVDAYVATDGEIRRYAEFRATADRYGRDWRSWPTMVDPVPERISYHETVQWLMNAQLGDLSSSLRERGQCLYLDLPVGCHGDGYDIWDRPDMFAAASLGAPPDTLFVGGQDWGLPATIPSVARAAGHSDFRKAIRNQLSVAGLLRIDHVMGLVRTWWVPHGASATEGAYVMHQAEELFAIICIESRRSEAGIVGENLGTVPVEIRDGMDAHGLLGMAIAQDGIVEPAPTDLMAFATHDMPPFAAWWDALDIDDLFSLDVFDRDRFDAERRTRESLVRDLEEAFDTSGPAETRDAVLAWMAASPAAITLVTIDDLLMDQRRQNVPGTDQERPNWRLRYDRSVDCMQRDDSMVSLLRSLSGMRDSRA